MAPGGKADHSPTRDRPLVIRGVKGPVMLSAKYSNPAGGQRLLGGIGRSGRSCPSCRSFGVYKLRPQSKPVYRMDCSIVSHGAGFQESESFSVSEIIADIVVWGQTTLFNWPLRFENYVLPAVVLVFHVIFIYSTSCQTRHNTKRFSVP